MGAGNTIGDCSQASTLLPNCVWSPFCKRSVSSLIGDQYCDDRLVIQSRQRPLSAWLCQVVTGPVRQGRFLMGQHAAQGLCGPLGFSRRERLH